MTRSAEQRPDREAPCPVEWPLASGSGMVRALCWLGGATPVVLVHDVGETFDLDRWGGLPDLLHDDGYTVFALDLPGHGLSDGDFSDAAGREAVQFACREAAAMTGHSPAVIAAGGSLRLLDEVAASPRGVRALIVLSPPEAPALPGAFPKMAFVGAAGSGYRAAADQFLRQSRGWTLVSSFATTAQGHDLLQTPHAPAIAGQILAFLRDYQAQPDREHR